MSYSPASSSFPTSKTTFIDPNGTSDTSDFDHAGLESSQNDAIENLEDVVGITGSADTASLTYKLTNTSQSNPGHKHTLADGATDVTASAAELNQLDGVTVGGTTAGDIVDLNTAQTLTNKTLTSPTVNSPSITSPSISSGDLDLPDNGQITENSANPYMVISLPAEAWTPATTSGCGGPTQVEAATNDIDYFALEFDTTTAEVAFKNFRMPDNWDAGAIQFRYVWTNAAGLTTETLKMQLSGRSFANDDAIDQAVGTAVGVTDTWIAQGDIHYSDWSSDVTLAGTPAAGEWIHLELDRDVANDDLTGDARIIEVQVRYKISQYAAS